MRRVRAFAKTCQERRNLIKISPLNDGTMFLPIGKSDAPSARCVLLARFGLKIVIAKHPNSRGPRGILCTRGGKSKTKKQGEFLKYQELTRVFLEISLKNKQ